MRQAKGTISGSRNEHHTVFYGLSTCIWCKRTRQFLESQGVGFDYIYVDLLSGAERAQALSQVRKHNPAASFPTIVVDGSQCVVGFRKDELTKALGL